MGFIHPFNENLFRNSEFAVDREELDNDMANIMKDVDLLYKIQGISQL